MQGNIYIPDKDKQETWANAELLAKALGQSRSERVLSLLEEDLERHKAFMKILERARNAANTESK